MNISMRRNFTIVLAFFALIGLAAACGSSGGAAISNPANPTTTAGGASGASGGSSSAVVIHIRGYAYHPAKTTVKPGQKITFINDDAVSHTATANNKSFDTGTIKSLKSKTVTVKAGVTGPVTYFCTFHTYMKGTITVTP